MVPARSQDATRTRRRYESPLREKRAAETRSALLDAATALFTTKGWGNTGMREVAAEAGVAVETLYSHFPSKKALLRAVGDHAVTGDDEPVALAARPEFLAMGKGGRVQRIRAAAALVADVNQRTIPFAKLLREAASIDAEIAESLRDTRERQRLDVAAGVALVLGRAPSDDERDGAWAIVSPEVYLLLVEESGWTHERYQSWLGTALAGVLPR